MPKLQLAVDFIEFDRAINIAEECKDFVDIIEVGTPLIKSEGMNAVREFRKRFKDKIICADMKTIDTGRLEVEIAAKSGADIVAILGVADDSMIKECLKAGKNYGCRIMVDMINVENLIEKSKKILEIDNNAIICVHLGIDQQMTGKNLIDELKNLSNFIGKESVAAAGGINITNAKEISKFSEIIIVGQAITKSRNAAETARKIKEIISGKEIYEEEKINVKARKEEEILEIFRNVSVANISDAMHRAAIMENIKPIKKGMKLVGKAITVRTSPGDWAKAVEAIEIAKEGDVIVISAYGSGPALWGELASLSCIKKGINGVVIDGAVRDTNEIAKLNFPCFAKIITANAGEPKGYGEINVKIKCGNVEVDYGDYIVGDDDGVIVIPKDECVEIANRALDVYEKENRIKEEISRGKTLSEIQELKKWEKVR